MNQDTFEPTKSERVEPSLRAYLHHYELLRIAQREVNRCKDELDRCLKNLARAVPDGLYVFEKNVVEVADGHPNVWEVTEFYCD